MKIGFKSLSLCFAISILSTAAFAGTLPEGSFKGKSSLIKNFPVGNDVMALLLKKDPTNPNRYYAVVAEYDRVPLTNLTKKSALTKWVNRLYAYRAEKISDLEYSMTPLRVAANGDIEVNNSFVPDHLTLRSSDTLNGAVLVRFNREADEVVEKIEFNGQVGSTWEDYVAGKFFGTSKKSGGDYFSKAVNTELSEDGIANFQQKEVKGQFEMSEKAPGMFTFTMKSQATKGSEKIVNKIAVFVDIVNWKHLGIKKFTTEELLLINPDDAADIGFYYERH